MWTTTWLRSIIASKGKNSSLHKHYTLFLLFKSNNFFIYMSPFIFICMQHYLELGVYNLYGQLQNLINPRRACAASVTVHVVVLCVCVCVCVCVFLSAPFRPLRVKVSPENDTNASSRQDKDNKTGDFLKNAPFKSYGVICSLCRRSAVL